MDVKNLGGLTASEIFELIEPFKFTYSHALSIANSLYKKKLKAISDFPKLPLKLKDLLLTNGRPGYFPFLESVISEDKSVKYLFRTSDGRQYETVYLPDGKRHTVCVSTQSGCRMGCPFCVSGSYGFHGNLTTGEIINQVVSIPYANNITHVVFMGMGEPLDNPENVLKACEILTAEWGFALSPRNVTISTVGLLPAVKLFLSKTDCNLTLSLHSPFALERKQMVPAENKYPSADIIRILREAKLKKGRRLTVAYIMISGLNDTERHLEELIYMLKGSSIRVNLLPYHAVNDDNKISSSPEKMQYFKHNLIISGISASVRKSRGADISAACGLLAAGLKINSK
ncbi:MAG: radical SAM protein [Bacteroidetes bacterium]|nr:radical SAM protein [Bacteroidota bacterium]